MKYKKKISLYILPVAEKFSSICPCCSSLMHPTALPQLFFCKWVLTARAWRLQHLSVAIPQARLWISLGAQRENNNIIRELRHHIVHAVIRNLFLSVSLWDTHNLCAQFGRGAKEQEGEWKVSCNASESEYWKFIYSAKFLGIFGSQESCLPINYLANRGLELSNNRKQGFPFILTCRLLQDSSLFGSLILPVAV